MRRFIAVLLCAFGFAHPVAAWQTIVLVDVSGSMNHGMNIDHPSTLVVYPNRRIDHVNQALASIFGVWPEVWPVAVYEWNDGTIYIDADPQQLAQLFEARFNNRFSGANGTKPQQATEYTREQCSHIVVVTDGVIKPGPQNDLQQSFARILDDPTSAVSIVIAPHDKARDFAERFAQWFLGNARYRAVNLDTNPVTNHQILSALTATVAQEMSASCNVGL